MAETKVPPIVRLSYSKGEQIIKEGAIVGEMVMLKNSEGLRTASVVAEGRVRLGILDKERLQREYELLSPQLRSLIKTLALRLEETTRKASLLAVE